MGLLTDGHPLSWEETKKLNQHVRKHGIQQFINLYQRLKDRQGDELKWGDEVSLTYVYILLLCFYCIVCEIKRDFLCTIQVEYILVKFFDDEKVARVSLKGDDLLPILNKKEMEDPQGN